jgi:probable O-glycosylation ligase (exosortase A-associated)
LRAIFFLMFFVFALIIGVRAPFVAALVYLWVDLIAPQSVAYGFIEAMPLAMISGVCSFAFYFLFDKKERVHLGFQWMCLALLLVWVTITTAFIAELPEYAWIKWGWASKTLLFACFMPFVFRSRVRLEALLLTIATCVGVIAISLAVKTLAGGAAYGSTHIWGGVNGTALGESSSFALVAASMIPFIFVLARHSLFLPGGKKMKWIAYGTIALFIIGIVGSYARTGVICLGLLGIIVLLRSRHKIVLAVAVLGIGLVALPLMPKDWTKRMGTLENSEQESSASMRIGVWKWTLGYVAGHPLGGGFEVHRINEVEYSAPDPTAPNDPTRNIKLKMRARAFHSNYFEMLGEHGYPGLILFLIVIILSFTKSWRVWRAKLPPEQEWLTGYAGANLVSLVMIVAGGAFAGNAFKIYTYIPCVIAMILLNVHRNLTGEVAPGSKAKEKIKMTGGNAQPVFGAARTSLTR